MILKSNVRCLELDPSLTYFFKVGGIYPAGGDLSKDPDLILISDPYGERWNAHEFAGKVKLYGFEAVFEFI